MPPLLLTRNQFCKATACIALPACFFALAEHSVFSVVGVKCFAARAAAAGGRTCCRHTDAKGRPQVDARAPLLSPDGAQKRPLSPAKSALAGVAAINYTLCPFLDF